MNIFNVCLLETLGRFLIQVFQNILIWMSLSSENQYYLLEKCIIWLIGFSKVNLNILYTMPNNLIFRIFSRIIDVDWYESILNFLFAFSFHHKFKGHGTKLN